MRRLMLILLGLAGCTNGSSPPAIVVGHVSDLTRIDKAGNQAELGIRLALHELDKEDTLTTALGGRKLQPRHTDTRGNLDAFESQAVRLETVNRAVALLGGNSAKEVAALDHVKIPILTFHGQSVSGAGKHVFYLGMSATRQGTVLAKTLGDNAKTLRVGLIIDERSAEAAFVEDAFKATFLTLRRDANILSLRFGKDAKWSDIADRLQTHEAQAVIFAGSADEFNAWHKSFRRDTFLNAEVVYAGPDGSQRLFDIELGKDHSILLATALHPDPAYAKAAAFRKAYREAFQVEADVNAALAYDGFRVLAETIKQIQAQPLAPDRLREELLKVKDFEGVTGPLTITPERQVQRPIHVVRWRAGTLTLERRFDAPV